MRLQRETILRAAIGSFVERVKPELQSAAGKTAGDFVLLALGELLARDTTAPALFDNAGAELERLCAEAAALGVRPDVAADAQPAAAGTWERTWQRYQSVAARALAVVHGLIALRARDAASAERCTELLADIARVDIVLNNAFIAAGNTAVSTTMKELEATVRSATQPTLEAYLCRRFPERDNLRVRDFGPLGFGLSKFTFGFAIESAGRAPERLVMRQERPTRIADLDTAMVVNEFEVLKDAHALGLPVAEPVWVEAGRELGAPFLVSRRVDGSSIGGPFSADGTLSEAFMMQVAELMATLHGHRIENFGNFVANVCGPAVTGMSIRGAVDARLADYQAFFEGMERWPLPAESVLWDWLRRNAPDNPGHPVLVHGDFNIHNMLVKDERIVALLDWEFAHAGDPVEDLANILPHVQQWTTVERFYNHYRAHGGPEMNLGSLGFYKSVSNGIFGTSSNRMADLTQKGVFRTIEAVAAGDVIGLQFLNMSLEAAFSRG